MKLWAIKMLFVWRYRLGYWAWDAFWAAFTVSADFKFIKAGNTYAEYECLRCGQRIVVDMEDHIASAMDNHIRRHCRMIYLTHDAGVNHASR